MIWLTRLSLVLFLLILSIETRAQTTQPMSKLNVLIVDGMNNHDWPRATKILRSILESSGRFNVEVATCPVPTDGWKVDFTSYDVVLSNFNGGHNPKTGVHWPRETEDALENFVRSGGGLVIYHAANNSFPNWPAYNEMIGLGWRDPDFGPSIVIDKDEKVVPIPRGQGRKPGHGPEHDFLVTTLNHEHPITAGMPKTWLHPHEQLTHGQHGPAKNMTVLTYAWSKDVDENEPMDWVVNYGKGRVYTTMLGHLWKNGPDDAMRCAGFQTLLLRGTEWAGSGNVTIAIPDDFPTASQIKMKPGQQ